MVKYCSPGKVNTVIVKPAMQHITCESRFIPALSDVKHRQSSSNSTVSQHDAANRFCVVTVTFISRILVAQFNHTHISWYFKDILRQKNCWGVMVWRKLKMSRSRIYRLQPLCGLIGCLTHILTSEQWKRTNRETFLIVNNRVFRVKLIP